MDAKGKQKGKEKAVDLRSDYEKQRDANIAKNKAILEKLDVEWEVRLKNMNWSSLARPILSSRLVKPLHCCYAIVDANIDVVSSGSDENRVLEHSPTTEMVALAIDNTPEIDTSATDNTPEMDTSAADNMPSSTGCLGSGFDGLFSGSGTLDSRPTDAEGEVTPSKTASAAKPGAVPLDLTLFNTGAWPPWLSNGVEYLKGISSSPEWVALITKLVAFEEILGFCNTVSLTQSCNMFRFLTSALAWEARMRQPARRRTFMVEERPQVHDATQDK
jgi:hypothetical protein